MDRARVRSANEAFYRAFIAKDAVMMAQIWSEQDHVVCIHPGMRPLRGREEVLLSWREIFKHPHGPSLGCTQVEITLLGETAIVHCLEGRPGDKPRLIATNLFHLEEGEWRLVVHHSGPLARPEPQIAPEEPRDPWGVN